ncbi:MAG TPA: Na/Pi cotransporter family protein [Syntrophales bacterium]|nr:Na/Pi cotransporter family protein [Syntrophales bacterium]
MLKDILTLCAGFTLLLFGMMKLSAGVQQFFTSRIRRLIRYAVKHRLSGLLTGIGTTVLFQSSSASTVLTIGMVSAGLVTFSQSLAVILGADIGTTLTVQLIIWKFTDFSPVFIVLGGTLWIFSREGRKDAGEAVFYFGLIFFGLSLAAQATAPLRDSAAVVAYFRQAQNPLIGVLVGAAFTAVVHASAIPVGMLVILGQQDLISLQNALPIVFGANLGSTATALISSAATNVAGKRSALAHFIFKATGVIIALVFLRAFTDLLESFPFGIAQQIALGHFFFNALIVVCFIFILKPFARLMERLIPGRDELLPVWPEYLREQDLARPDVALAGVARELGREMALSRRMFDLLLELRQGYREGIRNNIVYLEMMVNNLRAEIVAYLRRISVHELNPDLSKRLFAYTAQADDLERLCNHLLPVADLIRIKRRQRIDFSAQAMRELAEIEAMVGANLLDAEILMTNGAGGEMERLLHQIAQREECIDDAVRQAREAHLVRFHQGVCQAEAGPIFLEMLIHLERISDHCQNIADDAAGLC